MLSKPLVLGEPLGMFARYIQSADGLLARLSFAWYSQVASSLRGGGGGWYLTQIPFVLLWRFEERKKNRLGPTPRAPPAVSALILVPFASSPVPLF
jgi:hypothetical protein